MKKISLILFCLISQSVIASSFCNKIDEKFKLYNWGDSECQSYQFTEYGTTAANEPLNYTIINPEKSDTILFMCGVHGDEITPVKFCFDLLKTAKNNKNKKIVVVPLVSPDSFFPKLSRTNSNGVDVNRNFPTKDWDNGAIKQWNEKYRKDKRRFPGSIAGSEIETKFQMFLIENFKPQQIFSVHSPLQVFDYDGPHIAHDGSIHEGKKLLDEMSKKSKNYRKGKLNTYPGSLGNWAGKERQIPTFTLELPSSNPAKHLEYWNLFKEAIDVVLK